MSIASIGRWNSLLMDPAPQGTDRESAHEARYSPDVGATHSTGATLLTRIQERSEDSVAREACL